ncbi:hypothetical protein [Halococcus hamelinensis]|uniref:Uncharacterized protein n=1 Tax=Halococcus hamelinensis 100A6 TaxID=1132509 RepID=M0M3D1_9EURY|nr:hypothetical protein [Halococcus hamelinensis]EMA38885.1 hypothetical protein C447_08683 [Halococcus hamelinensis 100A6]
MSASLPGRFDHPSWLTAVGTLVAYGIILLLLTVVLFVVPYLVFLVL